MNKTTGIGFDTLFDNASMGIIIADEKGQIVLTNAFLQQQFGYTSEELINSQLEKVILSKFTPKQETPIQTCHTNPESNLMDFGPALFGLKKDGTEFPVKISISSYTTEQGNFTISFISDITARKKAELELKILNEQLEAKVASRTSTLTSTVKQLAELITETELKDVELSRANIFLRSIWGYAEVILFVTDAAGVIKMFNPAAERELGYQASELINKCTPATLHSPESLTERAAVLAKALKRNVNPDFDAPKIRTDMGMANELEIDYLRKDGSKFPASLTITAMHSIEMEQIEGYLGMAINISKQKDAEEEMQRSLKKEKEVSEFKSRFVSMASHEFRTPLSTILSSVYLISKYTTEADQGKRALHVERIVLMVQQLTDILNEFLSLEKIEENKVQVTCSIFNLQEFIEKIISELENLKKSGQKVHFSHKGNATVNIDQAMLKHIVINLLSNAIKFSPTGSQIEIKSSVNENGVSISFRDHGIGIPKEDQPHLFERFFRAHNATNIQGTGLGLHIVSRYIELMGGSITYISLVGSGTEFKVKFSSS